MSIQFEDVAAAALAMHDVLLPQWLGGGRKGHEWLAERKANGGLGDSWAVNLNTGNWLHGAGDEAGLDLVSLYAALNHIEQLAALKAVAELVGITEGRSAPVLPRQRPEESKPEAIPADAPMVPEHPQYGAPKALYAYGDAFRVARYEPPDGKQFRPFTWRGGKWHAKGYPAPRPLYHAEQLAALPDAPVLIVEGEKCADIATQVMRRYVVLTWANGAQAVKQSDWTPLAGRDVIIWPDADEPGAQAAASIAERIVGLASRVRLIQPNGHAQGWDIADAVAEGWDAKRIALWAGEHIKTVTPPEPENPAPPDEQEYLPAAERQRDEDYPDGQPAQSVVVRWQSLPLATNDKKIPHATLSNASLILRGDVRFAGKIWLDTFRDKIYHSLSGAAKPWTDADTRATTAYLQQSWELPKFSVLSVQDAVLHAAECNPHNSVTEWLDSLEWDGIERIETWLSDCLGVEHNEYTISVAKNWLIGMVKRAYVPGCKMDHMPVLEGPQGLRKTTFLETLGGQWYKSLPMQFGEKDFLQAIQGAWLVEIPDMTGFSRREHSSIISTITIRNDEYRKSYGRVVESHPRTTIFSATSERDNYLSDIRGRRRYWPLRCKAIDIEALMAQREHLFAEATVRYRRGESFWEMPESTDAEQMARNEPDPWAEKIIYQAEQYFSGSGCDPVRAKITCSALLEQLGVPIGDQTQTERNRVTSILEANGWKNYRTTNARVWYCPRMVVDKASRWSS